MKKQHYILITVLIFIIAINILFFLVNPEKIIDVVGIENSYLIIFIVSTIGGISSLTGVALFTSITTFAAGGAHPLILGIVGGIGIFISDSIFYHIARYGHHHLPKRWKSSVEKGMRWAKNHPLWVVLGVIYLYLGFTPLPADILMITLALAGYSYRTIAPVLFAGSITVALLAAYLGNIWANFL